MSLEMPLPKTSREKKVLLKDLNALLTCTLCNGYFIEAMTFDSCLHSFCRSCVLNHFETTKQQACPKCDKKKASFKPDHQLQALVYKMVPGLFGKETQRREDFYRSNIRASSTCSEDSVLGDVQRDQDKWLSQSEGTSGQDNFFSPEDPISLSLEFYQSHLDDTDADESNRRLSAVFKRTRSSRDDGDTTKAITKAEKPDCDSKGNEKGEKGGKVKADRRYLQCPAAVSMSHLQKFLRMKYALSSEHRVDIIYEGEVLPFNYTLMDVAYTYNWTKLKPMRFFYRIFTPLKVQPIKIINTSSSNGSKHLQIVPVRSTSSTAAATPADLEAEKSKEQFVAQLKLQSKHKSSTQSLPLPASASNQNLMPPKQTLLTNKSNTAENCIFEYEEADEEIKRFAESRDREWARMRHEDIELLTPPQTLSSPLRTSANLSSAESTSSAHHVKKRKKSKHSKGDAKKPKIHAEITSEVQVQLESIKLKVKLTPAPAHHHQHNGHKHKHRSPASSTPTTPTTAPAILVSAPTVQSPTRPAKLTTTPKQIQTGVEVKKMEPVIKLTDICIKKADKPSLPDLGKKEKLDKKLENKSVMNKEKERVKTSPHQNLKPTMTNAEAKKKEEQKTFLKTFPANANARPPVAKVQSSAKTDAKTLKPMITYSNHTKQNFEKKIATLQMQALSKQMKSSSPHQSPNQSQNQKSPQNQQQMQPKEKKVSFALEKPHILNSQHTQNYPSAFTVSKVEQGTKRKAESDGTTTTIDKRPCLEITLINPKTEAQNVQKPPASPAPHRSDAGPPKAKRPPPATIPLERIKKSNLNNLNLNNNVKNNSRPEGALDLTKKEGKNGITTLNGMKFPGSNTTNTPTSINSLTANLQMLSKVAIQHSKQQQQLNTQNSPTNQMNQNQNQNQTKVRPQIPNLQTLIIPHVTPSLSNQQPNTNQNQQQQKTTTSSTTSNTTTRTIPHLNEISKSNLKMLNNHTNSLNKMNSMVPRSSAQNMTRNIPNPAMVVRQHNQNRLNLTNGQANQTNQNQNQEKTGQTSANSSSNQPKILNPLAKENTNSTSNSSTNNNKEKDTSKESNLANSAIQTLMNKMLDQSKGQMMVTASTTAAT